MLTAAASPWLYWEGKRWIWVTASLRSPSHQQIECRYVKAKGDSSNMLPSWSDAALQNSSPKPYSWHYIQPHDHYSPCQRFPYITKAFINNPKTPSSSRSSARTPSDARLLASPWHFLVQAFQMATNKSLTGSTATLKLGLDALPTDKSTWSQFI